MTMQTQDIFNAFGSNWKWASLTVAGTARVHTEQPKIGADGVVFYNASDFVTSRCEAFDTNVPCAASIWERIDFGNGPQYPTDCFGSPYPAPAQVLQTGFYAPPVAGGGVASTSVMGSPAPAPMAPPPTQTRLTTEEAENGGLWDFARAPENYVSVNSFGVVWFNVFKDGPEPRRSYAVEVDGVTHPIERTRSQPQLAPPEAGKPFAESDIAKMWAGPPVPFAERVAPYIDKFDAPDAGDPVESLIAESTMSDAETIAGLDAAIVKVSVKLVRSKRKLAAAKERARSLLNSYDQHGEAELSLSIYLAIFGEQPK